jgi:hypothetical protein
MLTFKEFLLEKSRATLYHGTHADNVHDILKKGEIEPSEHGHTSTSRDQNYAAHYSGGSAHFHINHDSLKTHRKIQPTDFHMGGSIGDVDKDRHDHDYRDPKNRRDESEETVKGSIKTKHITHISIHSDEDHNKISKAVKKYAPHIKIKRYNLDPKGNVKHFNK